MHPVAHELSPVVGRDGLGHLVLVVGKDQVLAAAVDVERQPQMRLAHRRTLEVPARPAAAPGAVPARLIVSARLPQHEIGRVLLVRRDLDPGARDHLLAVAVRQPPVVRHRGDAEQDVAFGHIGVAFSDQRLDHGDHLVDVLAGLGLGVGLEHAQRRHVVVERPGETPRQLIDRLAGLLGGVDDLVVDVGDVADVGDAAVVALEDPVQHVEDDHRAGVAEMGEVVDRGPAHIHAHMVRIDGLEPLLLAVERVVENKRHGLLTGPRISLAQSLRRLAREPGHRPLATDNR